MSTAKTATTAVKKLSVGLEEGSDRPKKSLMISLRLSCAKRPLLPESLCYKLATFTKSGWHKNKTTCIIGNKKSVYEL